MSIDSLTRGVSFNDYKLNWFVVGASGGIHVWCDPFDFTSGGIEIHSRQPLYDEHKPHGGCNCWLIDSPCFHDGSSLQWRERLSRMANLYLFEEEQRAWWRYLAGEYREWFGVPAELNEDRFPKRWSHVESERIRLAAVGLMREGE